MLRSCRPPPVIANKSLLLSIVIPPYGSPPSEPSNVCGTAYCHFPFVRCLIPYTTPYISLTTGESSGNVTECESSHSTGHGVLLPYFADKGEGSSMRKSLTVIAISLTLGLMPTRCAWAQETAAPSSQSDPAAKPQDAPASNPQSAPPASAQTSPDGKSPQAPTLTSQSHSAFTSDKEKRSYALGLNFGMGLRQQGIDVDPHTLLQGLADALAGGKTLMNREETKNALVVMQNELRQTQQAKMEQLAEDNKEAGGAFLAANKTKPGVIVLPSGLQYQILTVGTGPKPTTTDTVVFNYKGMLLDNKEFDSSYQRGKPAEYNIRQLIKGWSEAFQLMPVGSKWRVFVPSDLAYGEHGTGKAIGPNATLIFELELLSIKSKNTAKPSSGDNGK
jgi:FKBP-type peptidyl-prolyl cis-trans isomerase FklB